MATTHLRACDVPELRQGLLQWADENIERGQRGSGAIQTHGFTDPFTMQHAVRTAELYYVNDDMTWLARTTGEGLPVCAFDADDLPDTTGLLVWSDDPRTRDDYLLGRPRAILWCRTGTSLRVLCLDDATPYREALLKTKRPDPNWARQVSVSLAGDLAIGFGTTIPLGVESDWNDIAQAWSVDKNGKPTADRYNIGAERLNTLKEDQLQIIRTFLGTLLLIRQPADQRRGLWQTKDISPGSAARKRLRRAGADRPDAPVRYITLRQSAQSRPDEHPGAEETAARIYRHRWFVKPHRRTYPDRDHPEGKSRRWVGPYLVAPAGCEDAPILGSERVNVLRR